MASQVYLLRHGETAWSLSGQHTGRTDVPLTAPGEEEARTLADRLRGIQFERVLSSPMQRARRTCKLAGLGGGMIVDPDLSEWDYGDYEGLRSAEILKLNPGWSLFRDGCPGGENPEQIASRADRVLARVQVSPGNTALFSHGHFLRVFAARWNGLPVIDARHFVLGTASMSILGFEHDDPAKPAIIRWNC